jgi:hypothetical protein
MDATLDQIPGFPLQRIIGPADELSHDQPATFGTDVGIVPASRITRTVDSEEWAALKADSDIPSTSPCAQVRVVQTEARPRFDSHVRAKELDSVLV